MKLILFANTDWYLYNFRRSLALAAKSEGHDVLLVSPAGPYGQKLIDLGLRWIPAPMERRSLNPFHELALLVWLWRLVRTEKADVVHSFTIKCAVYGGLAARFAGAARVNAVAGMGYVFISDEPLARTLRPIVWALLRLALGGVRTRLILQNIDDISLFEKSGIGLAAQIRLIPGSGVDCTRFLPPAESERRRPLRVVLAARMLWDKGVREFVEAARTLKLQGRTLRFQLAGGPDPGNPASISRIGAARLGGSRPRRLARSCRRHAGAAGECGHRRAAELSRGAAEKPDRGRRLCAPAGHDRCARLS